MDYQPTDERIRRLQTEQWSASEDGLTVAPRRIVDEQGQPVGGPPYWAVSVWLYGQRLFIHHVTEPEAIKARGAVYRVLDALKGHTERLQRLCLASGPVSASQVAQDAVRRAVG